MIVNANSLHPLPLASGSIQCAVTSPPYWGLRDYGIEGQLGLEPVPDCLGWATGARCGECYVCHMVQVFREVRRVLRDDGTLWLNLGDSYSASRPNPGRNDTDMMYSNDQAPAQQPSGFDRQPQCEVCGRFKRNVAGVWFCNHKPKTYKPKDLVGIPWRVAFALQADGWYLRSDIIWSKPNPMPESVTDRPTKAHEYVFLLAKSGRYYYDAEAVREEHASEPHTRGNGKHNGRDDASKGAASGWTTFADGSVKPTFHNPAGRNRRTVWNIATQPYSGAHFATFPEKLVEPCILAGTSERGCCPHCGAPWARQTDRVVVTDNKTKRNNLTGQDFMQGWADTERRNIIRYDTTGWSPTCACPPHEPRPCLVLDPFSGSGTVGLVARKHRRRFVGLDLNATYLRELALPRAEGRQTAASIATLPLFAQEAQ